MNDPSETTSKPSSSPPASVLIVPSSASNMTETEHRPNEPPQIPVVVKSHVDFPLPPTSASSSVYDRVFRQLHQHSTSDSTNTTVSNDSSPTTTISDSSATEPSPGSSPESPPPSTLTIGMLRPRTADGGSERFFELQKQAPPRKERNMKNLAVNTSRQPGKSASTTLLPLGQVQIDPSESVLPAFVKPPTPRKRKPNNLGLTITTPANSLNAPHEIRLAIPPTPSFGKPGLLRHFQSSPSLPLVSGLSLGDSPPRPCGKPPALDTIFSPVENQPAPAIEEAEEEQNFAVPLSREEKPEAYPSGPICVYEPSVDLYLEPTADQARQYDVILNVANEVRNPFVVHAETVASEPDLRLDGGGGIQYAPKRDRSTLVKAEPSIAPQPNGSPTTPKATPLDATFTSSVHASQSSKEPEYIHIPWDHNSDIVPDLFRLVKLIDDRVAQGKRVLIHCQCGVSRSASLVVAYGLYKNPSLSVQEAYDAVKSRSKWIGPNMNLIMQLQEFRTSLARGGILSSNRALSPLTPSSAISEWNGPFSTRKPAHESSLSAGLAPGLSVAGTGAAATTDSLAPVTPGPSSAPSSYSWPTENKAVVQRPRAISAVKASIVRTDPSSHVLPALSVVDVDRTHNRLQKAPDAEPTYTEASLASPRATDFAMTPLQPSTAFDAADQFGIMSPTATEFQSSPFDRSALLASLGMGSMRADEETPRRSLSLRSRARLPQQDSHSLAVNAQPARRLRTKISSPTLREQQQLQSLQAKIEASLPHRLTPAAPLNTVDEALMSPRATEFTDNPFALPTPGRPLTAFAVPASPARASSSSLLQEPAADPRSPPQKGASPIIRSIWDYL